MLSFLYSPTLTFIHDYCKTIALTRWPFVGKWMSLLFNRLSRLVITFLSRSKHLLISWLQSPSAVILEPQIILSHCFHCFPIYLPWSDGIGCHDLSFVNVESLASLFTLLFHLHHEALQLLFAVCHKGGIICISEVIGISPGNLDSSLDWIEYIRKINEGGSVHSVCGRTTWNLLF